MEGKQAPQHAAAKTVKNVEIMRLLNFLAPAVKKSYKKLLYGNWDSFYIDLDSYNDLTGQGKERPFLSILFENPEEYTNM
jgi:hypothetical protein